MTLVLVGVMVLCGVGVRVPNAILKKKITKIHNIRHILKQKILRDRTSY